MALPPVLAALTALFAALVHPPAAALPSAPEPFVERQRLRERERERELRQQNEGRGYTRWLLSVPQDEDRSLPEDEAPCTRIERIVLTGELAEEFQWALNAAAGPDGWDDPRGRCLGAHGTDIVIARLQRAITLRGYLTTRVLAGPQAVKHGSLTLTLFPGRIAAIRRADGIDSALSLTSAIPARPGDLLRLRDIEQGLDNLKRAPTALADIAIAPSGAAGARPGDADLVVEYEQRFPLRATLSLDDGGTRATGQTQAGATLAWDNPLGMHDLLYVNLSRDAFGRAGSGTGGQTVHYAMPWRDWLASATASRAKYHQTVQGAYETYVFAGESADTELKLSRLVYRDRQRKLSLGLRILRRSARNFFDDEDIGVQQRATSGWEFGLTHREFIGDATLDASLAWRRGTGAWGARPAPEEKWGEGTSRFKLATAEIGLSAPFRVVDQPLRFTGLWRAQWNRSPLTPQDRFAIGGRYTVRGFDGESSLMGERGWLLRSDLGWMSGWNGAELYAGIDVGQVGGRSTGDLASRRLVGGVVGLRGAWQGLAYDLFVGAPIRRPEGFAAVRSVAGFNLNYSF
ncbi:ShlB/FhaC/HecB family hemolysin secretion/activation protein [Variovorax sp. KK3]|uniref:ShlB/FhaC/HecB family hemolysin secretion/activation protein n=1 Tax=Variovorax sp. KK3 TaxID=1855728 RepID=UPI0021180F0A|nr:ShlB/FhaC/HecB family hemolysin secretion/activation protein [Variovorax sp. KK3]